MDLSTKNTFLVTYDIADPKRLAKVYRILRGWGDHLQLSVFRCELSERERVDLRVALLSEIHCDEDQVLFVDLGPAEGRGGEAISAIGKLFKKAERGAVVI